MSINWLFLCSTRLEYHGQCFLNRVQFSHCYVAQVWRGRLFSLISPDISGWPGFLLSGCPAQSVAFLKPPVARWSHLAAWFWLCAAYFAIDNQTRPYPLLAGSSFRVDRTLFTYQDLPALENMRTKPTSIRIWVIPTSSPQIPAKKETSSRTPSANLKCCLLMRHKKVCLKLGPPK